MNRWRDGGMYGGMNRWRDGGMYGGKEGTGERVGGGSREGMGRGEKERREEERGALLVRGEG
jgi:hypothetical protein